MKEKIKVVSKVNGVYTALLGNGSNIKWPEMGSSHLLTKEEIIALANSKGGRYAIENRLIVQDADLLEELRIDVEPEYFFTAKDVSALLAKGTPEQLEDALNYGGPGVRELIKEVAIADSLSDLNKLNLIREATGYDILKIKENREELETSTEERGRGRRKASVFDPNSANSTGTRERQVFDPSSVSEEDSEVVESPYKRN